MCAYVWVVSFHLFSFCSVYPLFRFCYFVLFVQKCVCAFRKNSSEWLYSFYIWKVSYRHWMRISIYGLISMLQAREMKIRTVHTWGAAEEQNVHAGAIQVQNVPFLILGHTTQQLSFTGWRLIYKAVGIIFFIFRRRCASNFHLIHCKKRFNEMFQAAHGEMRV